jgi:hypothetical protein
MVNAFALAEFPNHKCPKLSVTSRCAIANTLKNVEVLCWYKKLKLPFYQTISNYVRITPFYHTSLQKL